MTDPCENGNGGCTQKCIRTPAGTAECACNPGFDLQADGRTCEGDIYFTSVGCLPTSFSKIKEV